MRARLILVAVLVAAFFAGATASADECRASEPRCCEDTIAEQCTIGGRP